MVGGRVQVDADRVDADIDHQVEALLERDLIDIMLVLTNADALRIDLDQLGERILQATGN